MKFSLGGNDYLCRSPNLSVQNLKLPIGMRKWQSNLLDYACWGASSPTIGLSGQAV